MSSGKMISSNGYKFKWPLTSLFDHYNYLYLENKIYSKGKIDYRPTKIVKGLFFYKLLYFLWQGN